MRRPTSRKTRLRARRRELLYRAGAFTCHPPQLLDRSAKASELLLQIADHRLYPVAKPASALGKEEITGCGADTRAAASLLH